MNDLELQGLLNEALQHHQSGRLAEAEARYRRILTADAYHADALHLLGVVAYQVGRIDIAIDLIGKAIGINGNAAEYYSNFGNALKDQGRPDEALASYDTALRIKPDFAEALFNRGNVLRDLGRLDAALASYDTAVLIKPDFAQALSNRGDVHQGRGRLDDALASYDAALRIRPDDVAALSNRGLALQGLGRLDDALASYDAALRIRPDHAAAHSNRGLALQGLGRLDDALASYDAALRIQPDYAEALSNRGNTLQGLGRLDDALASYDAALRIKPSYVEALSNRGAVLGDLGRLDDALASFDAALRIKPDFAQALFNRGNFFQARGRLDDALTAYDAVLRINPDYAAALFNRGNAFLGLGRLDDALASYDAALRIEPDHAEAFSNRGLALQRLGRLDEALASCDAAVRLKPVFAPALANRGNVLRDLGRLDEALAACDAALRIEPDFAEARLNRGNVLRDLGRLDEALASYDTALGIEPDFAQALSNRGAVLGDLGRLDEALASCDAALRIEPDFAEALLNRGNVLRCLGRAEEALAALENSLRIEPESVRTWKIYLSVQTYHPRIAPTRHDAAHRRFEAELAMPLYDFFPAPDNDATPERRLRLAYLSSDFRTHPVALNLLPIIRRHDRTKFELYLYADVKNPDAATEDFRACADVWRPTLGMSDRAVAERVRADRIDVLVTLAGRFDENRPLVAAHRPAPVQISVGDVATSGLRANDYLIADRNLVPRETAEEFAERVLCVPRYYVSEFPKNLPDIEPRFDGPIVFGSLNNPAKINDEVLDLWARVLARVPGSLLLLRYRSWYEAPSLRARVTDAMAKHGVSAERSVYPAAAPTFETHMNQYNDIDIALDSFPFSGSTTTFEALVMGVPVVTLPGWSMVSRWSAMMLKGLELDDLIASDADQFVQIAGNLAANADHRARLRRTLRARVADSSLCAGPSRTRQYERLYRAAWRKWCAGIRPEKDLVP